ncbi:MAG: TetR/AcrR family transcriptional regulator [Lachnospiraceae bacterium]|nr:TetR/AcrR family transcriptional regulator [Lachnospiraceae bacterium]
MKTDARTRYTKMVIREAFFSLLEHKSVDKITVKEICDLAKINRATFYRYYENQYDLLSLIENEMLNEIETFSKGGQIDIDTLITKMCQLLYKNREEWVLLMGATADSRFPNKVYSFFNQRYGDKCVTKEQQMSYRFMLYGFSGLIDYWVKSGMVELPEDMASHLIYYRHKVLD